MVGMFPISVQPVVLCYDMLCHVFKNAMVPEMPCFQEGHVMVSNLPTISDAILWRAGAADCEMWDGHCHAF
ncbi:hypothetical protein TIFTF001_052398 [Ficus carica]|uniref:Uncharacterized protein n=1 Tax=Ficus carica TaxID=3494 RepID=A0AA88JJ12_FICCA|nr:hypothetical protein TIFTF001_052398 [Ficus carica]